MLDIKYVRQNPDVIKKVIKDKKREGSVEVDHLLKKDLEVSKLTNELDLLRNKRNIINEKIKTTKEPDEKSILIDKTKLLKEEEHKIESRLRVEKESLEILLMKVPNIYAEDVPLGNSDDDNLVINTWGDKKIFDFTPLDHSVIGKNLDLIDNETAAIVSGARFTYIKNEAVLLQFALIQLVFNLLTNKKVVGEISNKVGNKYDKPFIPVLPPVIARGDVVKRMDRYDPIDDRYYFEDDKKMFIGSAEHTLGPMHMDHTFSESDLPLRYLGYSTAFRREAGTYGKDTTGIFRRRQFDKIEMECFSTSEDGDAEQRLLVGIQEYLLQKLEIPYEVVIVCTSEMGKPDYRQIDINSWLPGQNRYRETHTSDYMTDFQSRRLNTRVKKADGSKEFVHMNDATAFAIGRALIAIIENYQQKDGSVVVPDVLRPYCGFDVIRKK